MSAFACSKPYPAYKDSSLPWLSSMPARWQELPGFSAYRQRQVKNIGMAESTVLSLSYGKLVVKPPEKLHGLVPASFETYQIVDPGNIIIRPTDLQNDWTSLRVGLAKEKGIITSAYLCLGTVGSVIPEYGYLLLHTYDLRKVFYGLGSGLRQNLSYGDIKRLPVLIPPQDEQRAIVRFLDSKLAEIDQLVEGKRRLIEVLNEQKAVIIDRAVIRGIDRNVKLKPSGIEWLGEIPEHWEIRRSKYVFREVDERSATGAEMHLSMSQKYGLIPSSQIEERRLISESYAGAKICDRGDLVLNRLKAHLGVFALASIRGLVSPDYTVFRPTCAMEPRYFEALYRTPACRVELRQRAKGIVQGFWRLYTDDFYDIRIPVPPLTEQIAIMTALDGELAAVNTVISRAEREIELVNEYRTVLISDAVTGKIDVRDYRTVAQSTALEVQATVPAKTANVFFRRQVLAAEIVDRHQDTPRFGRVKLQKLLVLSEYHLELDDIDSEPLRAAAGPFDNRMMRSIDKQLEKQKWFKPVKTREAGYIYQPLANHGGHRKYFDRYWGSKATDFDGLVGLLKPLKTVEAEIVATLYMAWNDFLILNEEFDDGKLIQEVRENWDPSKQRIAPEEWQRWLGWMRENDLTPRGQGKLTRKGKNGGRHAAH